jgi:hypothetical protein
MQIVHGTEGHLAVYGPVRHQKNIIWTEAYMAVYGPVTHQKNIIWTEAYMDAKILLKRYIFREKNRSIPICSITTRLTEFCCADNL